jgi:hypothetical protein
VNPNPTGVPSLDDLAADPSKAAGLPAEVARSLLLRATVVLAALGTNASFDTGPPAQSPELDRNLTAEEAGAILGVTPRWLYRHAHRLPFTRRLSWKVLRFSERGLTRWAAARRA